MIKVGIMFVIKNQIGLVIEVVISFVTELYIRSSLLRTNLRAVQQSSAHGYVQERTSIFIYIYIYIYMYMIIYDMA